MDLNLGMGMGIGHTHALWIELLVSCCYYLLLVRYSGFGILDFCFSSSSRNQCNAVVYHVTVRMQCNAFKFMLLVPHVHI